MFEKAKKFRNIHLEPRFYGALWFLAFGLTIAMCILAARDAARYKEEIVFLSAILALTLATVGWIWSGRMSVLMARKTNAMHLLERLSSDYVSSLKKVVYPYVAAYNAFHEADCDKPRPAMPETEIEQLLSVYEQASVAVVYGAVDHDMLKQSQCLVFKRIYLGLRHHIDKAQQNDPTYYEYFERLTCTWHPEMQRKAAVFKIPGGLFTPMQDADA